MRNLFQKYINVILNIYLPLLLAPVPLRSKEEESLGVEPGGVEPANEELL